jgi:hypothetical protein
MGGPTVEDLIWRAVEDERKRGPTGLSFAPVYSFVSAVAHMARGQERQTILDALSKTRPGGKSTEWNEGYNEAIAGRFAYWSSGRTHIEPIRMHK